MFEKGCREDRKRGVRASAPSQSITICGRKKNPGGKIRAEAVAESRVSWRQMYEPTFGGGQLGHFPTPSRIAGQIAATSGPTQKNKTSVHAVNRGGGVCEVSDYHSPLQC